jgi:NTP pyrophosphatase (non-canonical NTP hydrolase)
LEALRSETPQPSEKIEGHLNFTEELADTVIRIMDLAGSLRLDLADAIIKKIDYNRTRPHKHGKRF